MVEWVKLEPDIDGFDDTRFERHLDRARSSGIRFTTMAALGDAPEQRRSLYDSSWRSTIPVTGPPSR
ncbi:hypothetical protein Aph02nite_45970 [Actinoplanes philippinensis]|uniref:Uncharacterized protein n=1 Tax=Actinoplanes philippinensis TaxID=35752 RepID=A0A1I2I845_9ACTN|nr:hypothetical protein Aph02nite_45970 [Actinoplanes philippinensis]SFF37066.1 hypothetical protein SAMN05421541_109284 [Actinoplanes philippinensis]